MPYKMRGREMRWGVENKTSKAKCNRQKMMIPSTKEEKRLKTKL
jgi:hypothetical protein